MKIFNATDVSTGADTQMKILMSRKLFTIADYMNAELGTPNLEHETLRFDPPRRDRQAQQPEPGTRNVKPRTPNIELEPGTPNAKPGTLNLEL